MSEAIDTSQTTSERRYQLRETSKMPQRYRDIAGEEDFSDPNSSYGLIKDKTRFYNFIEFYYFLEHALLATLPRLSKLSIVQHNPYILILIFFQMMKRIFMMSKIQNIIM